MSERLRHLAHKFNLCETDVADFFMIKAANMEKLNDEQIIQMIQRHYECTNPSESQRLNETPHLGLNGELSKGTHVQQRDMDTFTESMKALDVKDRASTFSGFGGSEAFANWIQEMDRLHDTYQLSEQIMRKLVTNHITDTTLDYVGRLFQTDPNKGWEEIKTNLKARCSNLCGTQLTRQYLQQHKNESTESIHHEDLREKIVSFIKAVQRNSSANQASYNDNHYSTDCCRFNMDPSPYEDAKTRSDVNKCTGILDRLAYMKFEHKDRSVQRVHVHTTVENLPFKLVNLTDPQDLISEESSTTKSHISKEENSDTQHGISKNITLGISKDRIRHHVNTTHSHHVSTINKEFGNYPGSVKREEFMRQLDLQRITDERHEEK